MDGITPTFPIGGDGFGNGSGIWLFAILALMWGGFGGNRFGGYGNPATVEDLNTTSNFARLEGQIRANADLTERKTDAISNGLCTLGYDLQAQINNVNSNVVAQAQSIKDMLYEDKICALQSRINQLELANATSNIVRYPTTTVYTSGCCPFSNGGF